MQQIQALIRNVRYAVRRLRLSLIFTTAAVLTLALGIGGTTAIFTLVDAVMLRSLPVSDPARLYRVGDGDDCCVEGGPQDRWGMFSFPLFQRLRAEVPEFEELAAFQAGAGRLSVRRARVEEAARPLRAEYVTGNYFSTLGVRSFAGRLFSAPDDDSGASPVVVLSYHAWETNYGSDPSVIGSSFFIEAQPFTVIGIAPPGFFGDTLRSDPPDVWIPLQQEPTINAAESRLRQSPSAWLRVIGRLRPGASTAGIAPRLTGVLRQWLQSDSEYPSYWMPDVIRDLPKQVINIVPAGAGVAEMKESYGRSLQILFAVCGLVLLIACANVANLLLARSVSQRGQTAVRMAIGASRGQIVMQALTESIVLAIGGSIAGLLVASAAARLLLSLAFRNAHFLPINISPSPLVLGFALGLALITGVVFGAAPAWLATRTDAADALRGSGRSTGSRSSLATRSLPVLQAALSVVLVAGATMLGRSLNNLEHQDFGYRTDGRAMISIRMPRSHYTPPKLTALYRDIEQRLKALPGVEGGGLALYNPLTDDWGDMIFVAGHPPAKMNGESDSSWDRVSAGYMQSLGMTMQRGRAFTEADNETTAPVAIVNQAFVKRFFKDSEDPIDQHFGLDLPDYASTFRIIGVVRDAKFAGYALNRPASSMFFAPLAQNIEYKDDLLRSSELRSHSISGIMLKTALSPGALEPVLKKMLAEVDPNLTVISIRTLQDQVSLSFGQQRAVASLAGLFGIVALLLAAIGLYGVTAYSVAQRTNEIGIRMALGASRTNVVRLILRGASFRVLLGLGFGIPLAMGAGRLISAQLYCVSSWDPFALTVAAGTLAMSAFLAAVIPARRAASISPIEALRNE
jgi:predicted permease